MDARKTYKIQQQYYYDFAFFPIKGLKKKNFFVYKTYNSGNAKISLLFDDLLNTEVLDVNCIVAIRKKILKGSIPQTESAINELQCAQHGITQLMRIPSYHERPSLLYMLGTIHTLQRTLINYEEAQEKLTEELKKLLSNSHFTTGYRTSSDDISNVIDILETLSGCMQNSIGGLTEFSEKRFTREENPAAMEQAQRYVSTLVTALQKLLQIQQVIILQLRGWKKIRQVHEQQEVLN